MFGLLILYHVNSLPLYDVPNTLLNFHTIRKDSKLPRTFNNKIQQLLAEEIVYFFERFVFQDN